MGMSHRDVVAVFRHPPGVARREESYIIGDVRGILANIEWGRKKLGEFVEIVPSWVGCPSSEFYVLVWSFSLQSKAAQAKYARDILKAALPRKLRRLVSQARRYNRLRKDFMLEFEEKSRKTKGELFVERILTDEDRSRLANLMDPLDFWQVATGRVSPDRVGSLVTRQLALF